MKLRITIVAMFLTGCAGQAAPISTQTPSPSSTIAPTATFTDTPSPTPTSVPTVVPESWCSTDEIIQWAEELDSLQNEMFDDIAEVQTAMLLAISGIDQTAIDDLVIRSIRRELRLASLDVPPCIDAGHAEIEYAFECFSLALDGIRAGDPEATLLMIEEINPAMVRGLDLVYAALDAALGTD